MRRSPRRAAALAILAVLVAVLPAAAAGPVPSFRDRDFAYPRVLAEEEGGAYRLFADDLRRDDRRADGPGGRVRPANVSLGVRRHQVDRVVATAAGPVAHVAVGRAEGAAFIVVYLHGTGASRASGVDDFILGGNFNRLKNLVVAGRGLYLSPDFADFGATGAAEVAALIGAYAAASPGAPVVIACGSAGGALCWRLADDPAVAPRLAGLVLLSSFPDDAFRGSAAFRRRVPVFLGQGAADPVFPPAAMHGFFRAIRDAAPGYPVRLYEFAKGTHRTPLVMVDWRDTLNWMLGR